jgi:hypothetical protein
MLKRISPLTTLTFGGIFIFIGKFILKLNLPGRLLFFLGVLLIIAAILSALERRDGKEGEEVSLEDKASGLAYDFIRSLKENGYPPIGEIWFMTPRYDFLWRDRELTSLFLEIINAELRERGLIAEFQTQDYRPLLKFYNKETYVEDRHRDQESIGRLLRAAEDSLQNHDRLNREQREREKSARKQINSIAKAQTERLSSEINSAFDALEERIKQSKPGKDVVVIDLNEHLGPVLESISSFGMYDFHSLGPEHRRIWNVLEEGGFKPHFHNRKPENQSTYRHTLMIKVPFSVQRSVTFM